MKKQVHLTAEKRKTFGTLMKNLRIFSKLSLRESAEKMGCISFSALSSIERGRPAKISMEFLRCAAELYCADYDTLCVHAERIPRDVYYKLIAKPELFDVVRQS